jgi:hypothetical protein
MADFDLKGSLQAIDDEQILIRWTFNRKYFPRFVALARAAKDVTKLSPDVVVQLYGDMVEQARASSFVISPDDPRVEAHQRAHGVDHTIHFAVGPGFFQAKMHMYMLTSHLFCLFSAPGAVSALEMQLKSFLAAEAEVEETPVERGTRVVEDSLKMLAELDAARPSAPGV